MLRLDATYAYVAAATSLWRVPLAGGPVETLATSCSAASCYGAVSPTPQSLLVDGTSVYFTAHDGSLRAMLKSGGTSVAVTTGPFTAGAVDDSYVYGVDPAGTYPSVAKVPKGGGPEVVLVPGNSEWSPIGVALEGSTLYWNQLLSGAVFNFYNNQLLSVPTTGGASTLIAQQAPSNAWYNLTVVGGYAAWLTNGDAGRVSPEAYTTSGTAVPFSESCMTCQAVLAFDGQSVFFGAWGGLLSTVDLWIQPISGGASTMLPVEGSKMWALAVDAQNLYIGLDSYLLRRPK